MTGELGALECENRIVAGRYEIVRRLGSGGMGWVMLAQDTTLRGEPVALKFLYPHLLNNEGAFARFRNEALVARKLKHPNIVRTYNIGLTDEHAFIAMEYVDGPTVKSMLASEHATGMSLPLVLRVALQIGVALKHAHGLGIIHRDLKPDNVLVTPDGTIKMSDFGLAATLRRQGQFTRAGQVLGSPYYMPPEQFQGHPTDATSDIYSFGIVLYELLTGCLPFLDSSLYGLAQLHASAPLPAHGRLQGPEMAGIASVVARCTMKSRDERFGSMDELLVALRSCADGIVPAEAVAGAFAVQPVTDEDEHDEWDTSHRAKVLRQWLAATAIGFVVFLVWLRDNAELQRLVAVPLLIAERHLDVNFAAVRRIGRIAVVGPPLPLGLEMRYGNERFLARLESGDDPNAPENIERKNGDVSLPRTKYVAVLHNYPLHVAVGNASYEQIRILLKYGANPNVVDHEHLTPLYLAVDMNRLDFAELLLKGGADPGITAHDGDSPLFLAVRKALDTGYTTIVERLLQSERADPVHKNHAGVDPLSFAVSSGKSPRIVELLLNRLRDSGRHPPESLSALNPLEHADEIRSLLAAAAG